jgi:T-complex protein 1 subunit beta
MQTTEGNKISGYNEIQNIINSIISQIFNITSILLGPNGKNSFLIPKREKDSKLIDNLSEKIFLCSDTFTILKNMQISHPIGALLIRLVKNQFIRTGDGTTSTIIFTSSLHNEALKIIKEKIHPNLITKTYSKCLKVSKMNKTPL